MKKIFLFKYKSKSISNFDILNKLQKLKLPESDLVYVHSDVNFGYPNLNLKRSEILDSLLEIFINLNIKTLIFPTYTFSFCRNEEFHYHQSETNMGVLNEHIRKKFKNSRSLDPLLSNVLIGKRKYFVKNISKDSIGFGSTFDLIAKSNLKIKFLFFGSQLNKCFTFMHYLEFIEKVNYRYQKKFSGIIKFKNRSYKDVYKLFVRYSGIESSQGSSIYERYMKNKKILEKVNIGSSFVSCVDKEAALNCYLEFIKKNRNFFIEKQFNKNTNFKIYNKNKSIISL
jgi:aminoglycoside 3-N-acetyltransferase